MTRLTATTDDDNSWSRHLDSVGGRREKRSEGESGVGRVLNVRELEALYFKITGTTVLD
jgi:hypothetical protein